MTEHGWGAWGDNWTWSAALIAITIAVHASGVVLAMHGTQTFWSSKLRVELSRKHRTSLAIGTIVAVGLWLALLHGLDAMLWALVYLKLGAIGTPAGALLYSVDSMSTRGASGFNLDAPWRMMGALEAVDGMLLFGISTAFLFTILQSLLLERGAAKGE